MQGIKVGISEPITELCLFRVSFLLGRNLCDGTLNGPDESECVYVCVPVCLSV